jgi:hypothetical protein
LLSAKVIVCAIGLSLTLGAAEAGAAQAALAAAIAQPASTAPEAIRDLGDLLQPPDSDSTAPESTAASSVSSAEPVPELPTWAMMVLCLAGLGLARFKRGRKNRLSPAID